MPRPPSSHPGGSAAVAMRCAAACTAHACALRPLQVGWIDARKPDALSAQLAGDCSMMKVARHYMHGTTLPTSHPLLAPLDRRPPSLPAAPRPPPAAPHNEGGHGREDRLRHTLRRLLPHLPRAGAPRRPNPSAVSKRAHSDGRAPSRRRAPPRAARPRLSGRVVPDPGAACVRDAGAHAAAAHSDARLLGLLSDQGACASMLASTVAC